MFTQQDNEISLCMIQIKLGKELLTSGKSYLSPGKKPKQKGKGSNKDGSGTTQTLLLICWIALIKEKRSCLNLLRDLGTLNLRKEFMLHVNYQKMQGRC
jgi:hypothetical protein